MPSDRGRDSFIMNTLINLYQLTNHSPVYYITFSFQMAGYSGNANLLASSIQYIINVIMTIPALIWVDRWGRRPTLLIGSALMAAFMYANGGILASHGERIPGGLNGVPEVSMVLEGAAAKGLIACTYLFVASYAPTWGPVSWIYPPELFPLRLRAKGVSLVTSGNWAFNTALVSYRNSSRKAQLTLERVYSLPLHSRI